MLMMLNGHSYTKCSIWKTYLYTHVHSYLVKPLHSFAYTLWYIYHISHMRKIHVRVCGIYLC